MRHASLIVLCTAGLTACIYDDRQPPPADRYDAQLRLESNAGGDLELCDAAGNCQSFPNPRDCAVLVIEISTASGATCERCEAADGTVLYESCSETSIACTVVTAPEPDCVVCAHVGGAVVYSSCIPEAPECQYGNSAGFAAEPSDPSMPPQEQPCEICYDAAGREISNNCANDCSTIVCAAVLCVDGYVPRILPGDCCESCLPVEDCSQVVCPMYLGLPECPAGTQLVRDPADCCGYICEPVDCAAVLCPPAIDCTVGTMQGWACECPAGYHLDTSYPNCCGTCVPDADPTRYCNSDSECLAGEICSVGTECLPSPDCQPDASGSMVCTDVCYGRCKPVDYQCPQDLVGVIYCEGQVVFAGVDALGCPLPPVCVCADGAISLDGRCVDMCANTACFAPPPTCGPNEHLEMGYPYCCGVCVADPQCLSDGLATQCIGNGTCPAGEHIDNTDPCCPICVPDPVGCYSSHDCAAGQVCSTERGDCQLPPGCANGAAGCIAVCYGSCL